MGLGPKLILGLGDGDERDGVGAGGAAPIVAFAQDDFNSYSDPTNPPSDELDAATWTALLETNASITGGKASAIYATATADSKFTFVTVNQDGGGDFYIEIDLAFVASFRTHVRLTIEFRSTQNTNANPNGAGTYYQLFFEDGVGSKLRKIQAGTSDLAAAFDAGWDLAGAENTLRITVTHEGDDVRLVGTRDTTNELFNVLDDGTTQGAAITAEGYVVMYLTAVTEASSKVTVDNAVLTAQ